MTKGYKNPNDYVIQKIDSTPYLWEKLGRLYFWDVDNTCYEWSGETTFWVESTLFDYNWYWYENIAPGPKVTLDEANIRFPGAFPIEVLTNKKKSARRARILRAEKAANTDTQVFDEPVGLPRGFGFTDKPKHRRFAHNTAPDSHATARVDMVSGPAYFASYWNAERNVSGVWNSRRFDSKNEAQAWAIEGLRKLVKAERAAKRANEKEGEKDE
mgnify:CR=1 FL=1